MKRVAQRKTSSVRRKLLQWYAANARDLPWRRTRDPYAIWVSEIMLQQTRVDTVIPYYERFLKRFPKVQALAEADEQEVLNQWSGLGYYRRARLLHHGATQVCEQHAAKVPRDANARRDLSGVGAYTAGAIGSIAFGLEEPIVDGNIKRVLSRVFGIEEPINARDGERKVWALAEDLVQGDDPGSFNQAMMELGALVCTPKNPSCSSCPVRRECVAFADDLVHTLPKKNARKTAKREDWTVIAAVRISERKVALTRCNGGRFGGLWSLPMQLSAETRDPKALLRDAGLRGRLRAKSFVVRHQLTHRDMHLEVRLATAVSYTRKQPDTRFISLDRRPDLPTATLTHKLLAGVRDVLA